MTNVVVIAKFTVKEGRESKTYKPGQVVKNSTTAKLALQQGWAEKRTPSGKPQTLTKRSKPTSKALKLGAPENKDAAQAPNNASSDEDTDESEVEETEEETEGESAKE